MADLTAIIQRGRSVGVSVIASTQDPSTDTLPQKSVNNLRLRYFLVLLIQTRNAWHLEKLQQLETLKISEGSILVMD